MEIVGGFMVMMSFISLFLAVVWLIMPFVVFAIKGKQDRTLEVLEAIEKRLATLEASLPPAGLECAGADLNRNSTPVAESSDTVVPEYPQEKTGIVAESPADKKGPDMSLAALKMED